MKHSIRLSSIVVAVVLVGATACGPSEFAKRRADSAVAAAAKAHVVKDAGEVIGARREAQTFFDSARASFILKHRVAASKNLRDAAAFTRQQSDSAAGLDKDALAKSAKELDRLATGIANGTVRSVKTLDNALARAQLAEAQYHYTRMLRAWNRHDAGVAGAELTMSIDHFDRGASDAGLLRHDDSIDARRGAHAHRRDDQRRDPERDRGRKDAVDVRQRAATRNDDRLEEEVSRAKAQVRGQTMSTARGEPRTTSSATLPRKSQKSRARVTPSRSAAVRAPRRTRESPHPATRAPRCARPNNEPS